MAGARVQLSGFKELNSLLEGLPARVSKPILERAGTDAMELVARRARQLAPKDTEELAESIDVGTVAENDKADVGSFAYHSAMNAGASKAEAVGAKRDALRAVKGQRGNFYADVYVGPVAGRERDDVIKGYVQELGTLTREPQPYLRPALEQEKPAVFAKLGENIKFEVFSYLERSAKRRAGKG